MSAKVPVLRGRRGARKIDRLEFHPNDVFLHVRQQLGPTSKMFVVEAGSQQAHETQSLLWS